MDTKKCNTCHIYKHKTADFPKNGRTYRAICKSCHCDKQKQRYAENKEVHLRKKKEHYEKNKESIIATNKIYRQHNRDNICSQKKEYYQLNRDEILQKARTKDYKEKRNKYLKERRQTDRKFAMVNAYRARLNEVLHKQKKNTYVEYLSCKREEFLDWIEFQFGEQFSWESYGKKWVIDHVIPIDFFNIDDKHERYLCFSWFNLRPYNTADNLVKSNKIVMEEVNAHQQVLNRFKEISSWYQTNVEIHRWLRDKLRYGKNPSVLDSSSAEEVLMGNPQPRF